MIPVAGSFFEPMTYLPMPSGVVDDRGASANQLPSTGPTVYGSAQESMVTRMTGGNEVIAKSVYYLYFSADPSALNGGAGVAEDDAFRDARGTIYQACGPARRESLGVGCTLWRVDCVDVT
jgi:hypothetical protein